MLFKPKGISFDLYTDEELLNICTVEITENVSLDNLGHPIKNGLHDERMGPLSQGSFCHSCKQGYFSCPGHFGYIKTDEYIKPLTVDLVMNVLMIKCLNCKNYKIRSQKKDEKKSKKKIKEEETESDFNEKEKLSELEESTEKEKLSEEEELSEEYQSDKNVESLTIYELIKETEKFNLSAVKRLRKLIGIKKCMHCLTQTRSIHKINNELFIKEEKLSVEKIKEILGKKFDKCFSKIVLVTPNKFRPLNFMGNKVYEDSKNGLYSKILKEKNVSLISQIDLCIKSLIEKKEGIFRQNILGKRVNFSARSVISPDPNLETGEIGLPLIFAKKLSFPERVNEFNFNRLFLAVINGNKYPGATHLSCDDTKIDLSFLDENRRKSLAYQLKLGNKVVHRHVSDKDYLLVNRQPSLHKPSLMAHKVKVLQGEKTIRMHYANCNSYNADFDGDEMNLHLVQDYLAMSEAKNILSTDNNYKSDTNNKPIRGLVQDHIVGATLLTMKDSFFTQSEYFYLISSSEKKNKKIKSAILRPVILFTGKQVVSNLLINLNTKITFTLKSKVELEEVNFKNSHLLTGVLDKNTLGPSSFSLPDLVGKDHNLILSSFSKLINRYLIKYGFTLRINDLYLNDLGEKERLKEIKNSILQTEALYNLTNQNYTSFNLEKEDLLSQNGDLSEEKNVIDDEKNKIDDEKNKIDDEKERVNYLNNNLYWNEEKYEEMSSLFKNTMNKFTTSILNTSMENTLIPFPYNNLSLIVLSGAKGSLVNISQICCLLGQQELEGKRVPLMKNNLTLQILSNNKKESSIFESEVEKGGFIFDRFLTGIKIHSFFFHCMAGREGLIDTAVKTARSGYLQRCLVKHLEGLVVNYNGTVLNNSYSLISYQSKKESGTPVGLIAAQSIGEPSTQMTLNTFHLAGVGSKNVTLGIPRLREILMVNRTNKKYVVVKNTSFNSFFTKLKEILKKVEIQESFEERKIVKVKLELKEKIVEEVCAILNEKFLLLLNKKIKKVIQERVSIEANIVKEEQNEEINEEEDVFNENSEKSESVSEESSLSFNDEELNEENNFREKRIKVEENKKLKGKIVNKLKLSSSNNCIFLECVVLNNSELILYPFIIDTLESIKLKESEVTNVIKDTKEGITTVEGCGLNYMTKFVLENIKYDSEDFLVNNPNEEVLKEVEEIIKVMNPNPHQKKFKQIKVNNSFIDLIDKIFLTTYSNDIQSVNTVLGLEAGRTVLIKELKNVFDCYGISIDINHLNLIGDYMCRSGNIKAFNRNSFKDEDCLIQRMSFESTYSVLKNSLKKNIKINGPSSKQLIGGIIKEECEIIYDLNN